MTDTAETPATTTPSTLHPRNVNHLALSTCDMKAQLTYFAEVLGCPEGTVKVYLARARKQLASVLDGLEGELGDD